MPRSKRQARSGNAAGVRLREIVGALPDGLAELRAEASAEGYRFLERLAADWGSGTLRFTKPGEVLLAAYSDSKLVGIGGLTVDPVVSDALRLRRFYIRRSFRRLGIGHILATALLDRAASISRQVVVNAAATGSERFWESLGLLPDKRDGHTHRLMPKATVR